MKKDNANTTKSGLSRRLFVGAGAATLVMPALLRRAYAQDKFVCKIAHTEGIGTPITNAFEAWAKVLNEKSGGRIDAQHFPAAQLGGLAELLEGSRIGTIQVTTAGPDSEESIAPEIAAFGGAPGFIYKSEAHVDRVLQGALGQECSDIARAKTGVEFVAYGETGFRHILAKSPVASLDNLKGLKIRVPQLRIWVDFWSLLGAAPTPLPYSEQYSALSTGIIDAINSDVFSVVGFKFYEQAKYLDSDRSLVPAQGRARQRGLARQPAARSPGSRAYLGQGSLCGTAPHQPRQGRRHA